MEKEKKPKKDKFKIKEKSEKLVTDFKKFAFKGNIIDLAIAVIIGGAFGKIITSLVADVIMPCIGALIGDVDLSQLKAVIKPANEAAGKAEVAFRYGAFIQTIIEFFIIAISIFIIYKIIMRMRSANEKRKAKRGEVAPPAQPPAPTKTEELLTEIKDLLASQAEDKDNDINKR